MYPAAGQRCCLFRLASLCLFFLLSTSEDVGSVFHAQKQGKQLSTCRPARRRPSSVPFLRSGPFFHSTTRWTSQGIWKNMTDALRQQGDPPSQTHATTLPQPPTLQRIFFLLGLELRRSRCRARGGATGSTETGSKSSQPARSVVSTPLLSRARKSCVIFRCF